MRHTHIDELDRIPGEFGVYRPIRRALGVSAFGVNAYSADEGWVIEPHDEVRTNEEELYLVFSGHAEFAVGGVEGAAGTVSPWEYWRAAEPAYRAGDYARAYEIASEGLAEHPDNGSLHYNLACYAALGGRLEPAREHLEKAFAGDPRTREWAAGDEDLAALRPGGSP